MKDKSKLVAIVLVIITIIVLIVSFIINKNNQEDDNNDINIVTNYSNFYTVNSCLYRLITHISSQDNDSIYLLLSDDYKENNNVTKDNVLSLFTNFGSDSTFESRKMYFEQLSEDITKYYVEGYVEQNKIYDDENITNTTKNTVYFIVYLDTSNKIFSIEPYDGKIFKEGGTNER